MKNLKIAKKLAVVFTIVIASAIIVGCVGIMNISMIEKRYEDLYINQMEPMVRVFRALDYVQNIRLSTRDLVLNVGNTEKQKSIKAAIDSSMKQAEEYMSDYEGQISNVEARNAFNDAKNQYTSFFKPGIVKITGGALEGKDQNELTGMMVQIVGSIESIVSSFNKCADLQTADSKASVDDTDAIVTSRYLLVIAVLAAGIAISILLGVYITGLIVKPVSLLSNFMQNAAATGDIVLKASDIEYISRYMQLKDEIGECISSCAHFVERQNEVSKALETVAGGDLTYELILLSDNDVMGLSLQKMVNNLNSMFGEINGATLQVAVGSRQVSNGSQSLAQGSSQQATAVEQLSCSIAEIADKTKVNAGLAVHASGLAETIRQNAEKGNNQMNQMLDAVKEIKEASNSISKVIKVIDDIAFQTNILALNAAVEAARAGQHGKGFAVVAEEVRNLAAKSANAAKDTGSLIANSMEKAEMGARIAEETAASLSDIVEGISESGRIVGDIARSSEEQAAAIGQINSGIEQVAHVVHQNSATAQESASASEEMHEQANTLEELVARFKIADTFKMSKPAPKGVK